MAGVNRGMNLRAEQNVNETLFYWHTVSGSNTLKHQIQKYGDIKLAKFTAEFPMHKVCGVKLHT